MEDAAMKIFIAVSGPLLVGLVWGGVKLRDMVLSLNREIKWLCEDLKDLKDKYDKDKVERNSLRTMATSIDTKIDAKLKDILQVLSDQRHQDSQNFNDTMQEVKMTLTEMNVTLKHMRGDVDGIKNNRHRN